MARPQSGPTTPAVWLPPPGPTTRATILGGATQFDVYLTVAGCPYLLAGRPYLLAGRPYLLAGRPYLTGAVRPCRGRPPYLTVAGRPTFRGRPALSATSSRVASPPGNPRRTHRQIHILGTYDEYCQHEVIFLVVFLSRIPILNSPRPNTLYISRILFMNHIACR